MITPSMAKKIERYSNFVRTSLLTMFVMIATKIGCVKISTIAIPKGIIKIAKK